MIRKTPNGDFRYVPASAEDTHKYPFQLNAEILRALCD
jgi:hypothetical protein